MGGQGDQGGGRGMEQSNVLVERFRAVDEWAQLIDEKTAELQAALYDSGLAQQVLDTWSATVSSSGLVDLATVTSEAAAVAEYF